MKYRKAVSFMIAILLILGCAIHPYAMGINTDNMEAIVEDEEKNAEIDRLFALRSE